MTAVPLGQGAYKRLYAGAPEVKLLNRFLEASPANPREGSSILARPGTTRLLNLDPGAGWSGIQSLRGVFTLQGLFGDVLWVVCGQNLYYIDSTMTATKVTGATLTGVQTPEIAWQAGAGYQRMWFADGGFLYYYNGNGFATGTLTASGTISVGDIFRVGSTYYKIAAISDPKPGDGTSSATPFLVYVPSGGNAMRQLWTALTGSGRVNTDYQPNVFANPQVNASIASNNTTITVTARVYGAIGNNIVTTTTSAGASFGSGTLTGGLGILTACAMPNAGEQAFSITQVSGYVLVSVLGSNKFYWINPGDTSINALNFATKESAPDAITSMRAVGDQVLIMGNKSTENWYATGDSNSPFAPIEGRVYARGTITNTPVVVDDAVFLVGDDGRVYSIGFQSGDSTEGAGWGVNRISNNGIEERIRKQLRREQGLTP